MTYANMYFIAIPFMLANKRLRIKPGKAKYKVGRSRMKTV